MDGEPDAATRTAFLATRRRTTRDRYDRLHADRYDEGWGTIMPSHASMLERLLAATRPGGEVLDAACGTGKYWPAVLASGRRVSGIDQSAGMLAVAATKHPDVPTRQVPCRSSTSTSDTTRSSVWTRWRTSGPRTGPGWRGGCALPRGRGRPCT